MTVDPSDPDIFDEENEVEASDSDAAEQHADGSPYKNDSEQARVVESIEDDYR